MTGVPHGSYAGRKSRRRRIYAFVALALAGFALAVLLVDPPAERAQHSAAADVLESLAAGEITIRAPAFMPGSLPEATYADVVAALDECRRLVKSDRPARACDQR